MLSFLICFSFSVSMSTSLLVISHTALSKTVIFKNSCSKGGTSSYPCVLKYIQFLGMFVDLVSVCTFLLKYISVFLQKSCAVFGMSFITFFDGLTLDETFTDLCKINFEAAFLEITEAKLAILAHLSFNFFFAFYPNFRQLL